MDPVTYQRPVYYYETDRMDCVHHSNYISWLEEDRIHGSRIKVVDGQELEAGGIVSPVLHAEADYRTMARFGETMEIAVQVESYTGTRIAFSYQVRDKATGVLRCQGRTSHCFLNEDTGRPVSLKKAAPAYHQKVLQALGETE